MKITRSLLLVALSACGGAGKPGLFRLTERNASEWPSHLNERVVARGRMSETPMQHVLRGVRDAYMDIGQTQLVLVSTAGVACPGRLNVIGVLGFMSLGGDEHAGKDGYSSYHIQVEEVRCR